MSWWRKFIRWLCQLLGFCNDRPKPAHNLSLEFEMGTATVNWSLPTERDNDVPLAPEDIAGSYISMSADGNTFGPEAFVPAYVGMQEFQIGNLTAGEYTFRVVIEDTDGRRSDAAEVVDGILAAPKPTADLTVTFSD